MSQPYYETMYILRPDIPEEEVETHVTKYRDIVVDAGAEVLDTQMRGKRRLIRVQLLDVRLYGFAPVVENELIVGKSQRAVDSATLNPKQLDGITELATAHA